MHGVSSRIQGTIQFRKYFNVLFLKCKFNVFLLCSVNIVIFCFFQANTESSDKLLGLLLRPGYPYFLFLFVIGSKDSTCLSSFLNLTLPKLTLCVGSTNMIFLTTNTNYSKTKQIKLTEPLLAGDFPKGFICSNSFILQTL